MGFLMKTYLEFNDEKSHKFWQIELDKNSFTVTYGKLATAGKSNVKEFETEEKAQKEAEKLVKQKLKKGYAQQSATQTLKNDIDATTVEGEAYYISGGVRFYDNATVIKGDLNLEFLDDEDASSPAYFKGIVVEGDLHVEGNIFNLEDDYGKFLDVRGNLYANNLIVGGNEVKVSGHIDVKYFTIKTYNHGEVFAASITTPVLVIEESSIEVENEEGVGVYIDKNMGYSDKVFCYETLGKMFYDFDSDEFKDYTEDDFDDLDYIADLIEAIQVHKEKTVLDDILAYQKVYLKDTIKTIKPYVEVKKEEAEDDTVAFLKEKSKKIEVNDEEIDTSTLQQNQIKDITLLDMFGKEGKEIKKLPEFIVELQKLRHLSLCDNKITSISKEILNLKNLEYLDLSSNSIRVVPKSIKKLNKLEFLNLDDNKINVLPSEIGVLRELTYLNLRLNQIDELPSALYELRKLKTLNLMNCYTKLSDEIASLQDLEALNLKCNYIKVIPEALCTLINLRKLNLSDNGIEKIPESILKLENLEYLDLDSNYNLGEVPKVLSRLKKLSHLSIFNSRIIEIPSYISEFKTLEILDLHGNAIEEIDNITFPPLKELILKNNKFTTLSPSITRIESLVKLDFESNDITEIPTHISKLSNLEKLIIGAHNGELNDVPKELSALKNLKMLEISSNKFQTIPLPICGLENLVELDLGYNQISHIPEEINQLQNLEELYLGKNKMTTFPDSLTALKKLKTILMYDNEITHLSEKIGQMQALEYLSLSDNRITAIPESIGNLKSLQVLGLSDNNIRFIPKSVADLDDIHKCKSYGDGLQLSCNPIENIPEDIIRGGFSAVQTYLKAQV